jgi:hypothetical protein
MPGMAMPSNNYTQQIGGINGGSDRAKAMLLMHELGHVLSLFRSDSGSDNNQKLNNDLLWFNCGRQISGFSN